jgi:hypothetical protein
MNRLLTAIAATVVMFVGVQACAADSVKQPTMNKRQMIVYVAGCMKKGMASSKTVSYNQAMRVCRDQINRQMDNSVSGAVLVSATPAKP